MTSFDYLIHKIADAEFSCDPFQHVYVENFFRDEDFARLVSCPEIALAPAGSDEALVDELHVKNYRKIDFPGTATDLAEYLRWHGNREAAQPAHSELCEGYGVTFRLSQAPAESFLQEVDSFFKSSKWTSCLTNKFGLRREVVYLDTGLQKYLDGYEISPHPDIRGKALTYMLNINPSPDSEEIRFHTHLLRFLANREYVKAFWAGNPQHDRCWVPWDWCETVKLQCKNNSIVIFKPDNDTLHGVKARYNHLRTQRTQYYGNLWYREWTKPSQPCWRDFLITVGRCE